MIPVMLLLAQSAATSGMATRGEKIFAQNCSVGYCHGVAGAAGRGPRLRGRSFSRDYLYTVTRDGLPNSAMPAWKDRLKDDDIHAVVEYIESLASATDTAPANPMPPGAGPASLPEFNGPPDAARGRAAFFDPTRDNCGFCHAVAGRGAAVGPDLTLHPPTAEVLDKAVHSTNSRHALTAKLADGEQFPALLVEKNAVRVQLYDLTSVPPVLRTLAPSEVLSLTGNPSWRHRDCVNGYTPAELKGIAVYLRWAATGK